MSVSIKLDDKIKQKNSMFFRFIVVLYAFTIWLRYVDQDIYNNIICLFGLISYCSLFFLLKKKVKYFSILRLLNDFIFITLILYPVGTSDAHLAIFVLLPLLNSLNHTSESLRRSFSLQLYFFTISSFIISNRLETDYYFLIPIIAISAINLLIAIRLFLNRINSALDAVIENFYLEKEAIFKSYKVLNKVVETINENKFLNRLLKIKRITFFKIRDSFKPSMTISSEFIYNYELYELSKAPYLPNVLGVINGEKIVNGVGITLNKKNPKNQSNLILIEFEKKVYNLLLIILIDKIFAPIFTRILNINNLEYEIQNIKREFTEKMKSKLENIDSAANAVHFLSNKLTPLTNYFQMSNDLKRGIIPIEHKAEWEELIAHDFARANKNIKQIQSKMLQIAEYTNNPNIIAEFERVKIKSFISYLRSTYQEACFHSTEFKVDIIEQRTEEFINVNFQALDFVFTELIDNLNKHCESTVFVKINELGKSLNIIITNEIKDYKSTNKSITEYVNDFNDGQVNELLQRKGNKGIKFVKQFLQQLNVKHFCKIKDANMVIELKFEIL